VPALFAVATATATRLVGEVEAALAGAARGERLREGARIVIAGPPNAGKSTLLNALARRDVAIVSAIPGTTRDTIEVHLDLDGYPATLIDTAGLRQTEDPVEAIGVARALDRAGSADLVVWLSPADAPADPPDLAVPLLRVATKRDRIDSPPQRCDLAISALTGAGLETLTDRLAQAARAALEGGEAALVTRARHRRELEAMAVHLGRVAAADAATPVEFAAEDLRLAVRAIGRLTGSVDIDEIYDVIFRQFCIGK